MTMMRGTDDTFFDDNPKILHFLTFTLKPN